MLFFFCAIIFRIIFCDPYTINLPELLTLPGQLTVCIPTPIWYSQFTFAEHAANTATCPNRKRRGSHIHAENQYFSNQIQRLLLQNKKYSKEADDVAVRVTTATVFPNTVTAEATAEIILDTEAKSPPQGTITESIRGGTGGRRLLWSLDSFFDSVSDTLSSVFSDDDDSGQSWFGDDDGA